MADAFSYEAPDVVGSTVAPAHVPTANEFTYGAGANSFTLNFMMIVVFLSYSFLFTFLMMSCMYTPAVGFTRFADLEAESSYTEEQKKGPVAELDKMWRKAFIGKVYSILGAQLFVTCAISFAMMQFGGANLMVWAVTDGAWAFSASFWGVLISLCALMCHREKYPLNMVLLVVFTLTMSWMIGMTCTMYAARGMSALVVEAFAITSVIFVGLTLFTVQSKIDFSFLGLGLSVALFGLLAWGMFAMIAFPSFMFSQVYALLGSVIFSLYVVYDTWLITTRLSYDEHILGAISLYLDFINLFLMILRLLSGGGRE